MAAAPRIRSPLGSFPMTRIIAGFAGSLALEVPRTGTRPTSDRVREALFSALESRDAIDGARVLDLYAGTGALGLEAASRGATEVVLVEKNGRAAKVCRANAEQVTARAPRGTAPQVRVAAVAAQPFLETGHDAFDLVLIDPPYELGEPELTALLAALPARLSDDAVVLVERSARAPEPSWPASLELERRRDYGDTTVWFASRP